MPMPRYRSAFFITMGIAIFLTGALVFLWFHPEALKTRMPTAGANEAGAKADLVSQPSNSGPNASEPAPSEPKLAPVTLTPQRMQSIGVRTGTVEYKQVHDEIRTTGNVEADETRLAEV